MTKAWDHIIENLLRYWPEHAGYICKVKYRFYKYERMHDLARIILKIAGNDLDSLIKGYRWMCEMMLEEEIYFCRHHRYRFSLFAEVNQLIYQNSELMTYYMDGLLLSQILWSNHIEIFDFYVNEFLAAIKNSTSHLEIGPGHGLFLYYAAQAIKGTVSGWDISPSALEKTATCLKKLNSDICVNLECNDITKAQSGNNARFDSLVISEVLEHVEDPQFTLDALVNFAAPGAKLFINVPINSPSIDHIFHFKTPEEVIRLVENSKLIVNKVFLAPAACHTESVARKIKSTISCAIFATV